MNVIIATEDTFRNTEDDSTTDETTEAIASTKNYQDEVRQWFTAMSPEERAAAIGFEDDGPTMGTLLAKVAGIVPSCCSTKSNNNDGNNCRRGQTNSVSSNQQLAPTSSLPPKWTTDRRDFNGK